MKHVIALNGSPRSNGRTAELLDATIETLKSFDVEVEVIHLRKMDINVCAGCNSCVLHDQRCIIKDELHVVTDKIKHADGLILAAPVYMWNTSTWMKIFIDRLPSYFHRPDTDLIGKPVLTLVTAAGPMGGLSGNYMNKVAEKIGMWPSGGIFQMASAPKPVSGRQVKRFVKELSRDRTARRPGLGKMFNFMLQQASAMTYLPEDAAYFTAHGWDKGFWYHKALLNPLNVALVAAAKGLAGLVIKTE
jgi:multimeric flavodoxin WrbA